MQATDHTSIPFIEKEKVGEGEGERRRRRNRRRRIRSRRRRRSRSSRRRRRRRMLHWHATWKKHVSGVQYQANCDINKNHHRSFKKQMFVYALLTLTEARENYQLSLEDPSLIPQSTRFKKKKASLPQVTKRISTNTGLL